MKAPVCPSCKSSIHLVVKASVGTAVICVYCAGLELVPVKPKPPKR